MSLSRLYNQIDNFAVSLKLLVGLINSASLLLPENCQEKFHFYQAAYQRFHAFYQTVVAPENKNDAATVVKQLQECEVLHHQLQANIVEWLNSMSIVITHSLLLEKITAIKNTYDQLFSKESKSDNDEKTKAVHTVNKAKLEGDLVAFNSTLQGLEQGFIDSFQLKQLTEEGSIARCMGKVAFSQAKQLQHDVHALREHLNDFAKIADEKMPVLPIHQPLVKHAYRDLVFWTAVIRPEKVNLLLERKKQSLQRVLKIYQTQIAFLKKFFSKNFEEVIRLKRIIIVYQKWHDFLMTKKLSSVIAVQELLTYGKKSFFKAAFSQQKAIEFIKELYLECQKLSDEKKYESNFYQRSQTKKADLLIKVKQIEAKLQEQHSAGKKVLSACLLSITQQPVYHLGSIAAEAMSRELERYPSITILGQRLSDDLQSKLNHITGTTFLLTSLLLSNWVGYSYQAIATINHALLAQQDWLISVGRYVDYATQHMSLPLLNNLEQNIPASLRDTIRWLRKINRYDELGLVENEKLIHCLMGLGIQLLLSYNQPPVPVIAAYSFAILSGELANSVIDKIATACELTTEATKVVATLSHMAVYSTAYRYGFEWIHEKSLSTQHFSQAQALKLFGLTADVNEKTIKARYHQLAKENHPDKCGQNCDLPMEDIVDAYQTLVKKMQ